MSATTLLHPLNQLLSQAEALLVLAGGDEWPAVEVAMAEYLQAMAILEDQKYLTALKEAGLALEAQGLILQIRGLNEKVDAQAQVSHEKIASELRQIMQSSKALDAYGQ